MAGQQKYLSLDDVTNQSRVLLTTFIHERLERDGLENIPGMEQLQEAGKPTGPPMEHVRELGRALNVIVDEMSKDKKLDEFAAQIPPESEKETILDIAYHIFKDGIFNWGRVAALFGFTYKVCAKALNMISLVWDIINLVVCFMRDHVVRWILEQGGWDNIRQYVGVTNRQLGLFVVGGLAVCGAVYLYKTYG